MGNDTIVTSVLELLRSEFITGPEASQLTISTPLISGGLMDSISTLRLVDKLEKQFSIKFAAHEVDRDNLDTVEKIAAFIKSKSVG
ncbi:MAG: acyl carrier protein [Flavobacteriales bacterium]|nr:acyl carrier protein [Flavobacteriales bacterium]